MQLGKYKTISVDGDVSDWDSSMIIAQGTACLLYTSIFIAIAFLIDIAGGVNAQEAGSTFVTVTPAAAWFKTLGGVAVNLMVPILSGFIAMSIADRPGLLVGLVGGFLATSGATFADPGAVNTRCV